MTKAPPRWWAACASRKNDPRLEAYGTIDELNAHIGLLRQMGNDPDDDALLRFIQNKLFVVGSYLATDTSFTQLREASRLHPADITHIEERIDTLDSIVPPLNAFLLPGGTAAAAQAHVCRTVCRRAERRNLPGRTRGTGRRKHHEICQPPLGLLLCFSAI